ncbi:Bug family tripartite tricarboxylate transporter substrate binding protein [Bordetella tumulicola]|uniref:Bug family tripartite tricarboxylate transporter substrate binding protein n=1 Tax=Bordetella tumulicola TaxID=1649133 RepID=UPI0039EFC959
MRGISRKGIAIATIALAGVVAQLPVAQAAYPDQPIRIVVGYAAGGTTDILARVLGEQLGKELKQSVIIENKPGAAGNIAASYVQGSTPDGYTLFMATVASHGINPSLYKRTLGYDPIKGFEPVAMVASIPLLLIANPTLSVKSVDDLVALAKSKPGQLNYSSSGNGSPVHLAGAMFAQQADLDLVHVPYRGGAMANTAVMSGEAQFSFATLPGAISQVRANNLTALAVTTPERSSQLPDVPALGELDGFKGFDINTWNALMAPTGTPQTVVETLNAAVNKAMASPALRAHFEKEGAMPTQSTPAELRDFIASEIDRWAKVVSSVNIRVD